MSYEKQSFVDGQILTANAMNHIEDGISDVDAALAGKEDAVNDTGWQTLPLAAGITGTNGAGGRPTPSYRKIGNKVIIEGAVSAALQGASPVSIGTLPSGFRPHNALYKLVPVGGARIARVAVTAAGLVNISWAYNVTGSAYSGSAWAQLNMEFYVD